MSNDLEKRSYPAVTLRAAGRKLEGYAAVFNTETRIGSFNERIAPGAFTKTLTENNDILALVDHDKGKLLARTASGSLKLSEDAKGLHFALDLPDTQLGRDIQALAERRDLGGMSFGFLVTDDKWNGNIRELRSVNLIEISVVQAFPAYTTTEIALRHKPSLTALQRKRLLEVL